MKFSFLIILVTAVYVNAAVPEHINKKISIAAYIEYLNLQNKELFKNYHAEVMKLIGEQEEYRTGYNNYLGRYKAQNLSKPFMKNHYKGLMHRADRKDIAVVYLLIKEEDEVTDMLPGLRGGFMKAADSTGYDNTIENFSKGGKHLHLNHNTSVKPFPGVSLSFFGSGIQGRLSFKSYNPSHVETLKHVFRQLMKTHKMSDLNVVLVKDRGVQTLAYENCSPLNLYMTMQGKAGSWLNKFYGGFEQSGKLRSWGYLPDFYKNAGSVADRLIGIPITDLDNLRDSVLLGGTSILINNNIVGLADLKAVNDGDMRVAVKMYTDFLKMNKTKKMNSSEVAKKLDEILKVYPKHFSALLYKELLYKKFRPKITLQNSFYEFESFYKDFTEVNLMNHLSLYHVLQIAQKQKATAKLDKVISRAAALAKVSDNEVRSMCKHLTDLILTSRKIEKEIMKKNMKSVQNLLKAYFKDLRLLNYKRDMLIDSRKALDEIFK